ncbi:MAG: heavy metal-binding domain-containing protein [Thermoproteota archaeon]
MGVSWKHNSQKSRRARSEALENLMMKAASMGAKRVVGIDLKRLKS